MLLALAGVGLLIQDDVQTPSEPPPTAEDIASQKLGGQLLLVVAGLELANVIINKADNDKSLESGQMSQGEIDSLQRIADENDITFTITGRRSETKQGLENRTRSLERYGPSVDASEFGVPAWRNTKPKGTNELGVFKVS